MPGPVFARGDRVALRTLTDDDLPFLREHVNDPRLRPWIDVQEPVDRERQAAWLEAECDVPFLVCADGDRVGFLWFFRVYEPADSAELGYWIAPEHQGQGYATAAAALALENAFDERGWNRVQARVFGDNEASVAVLEKLGFRREGTLRQNAFVDGEYVDVALFGLLAEEWDGAPATTDTSE